MLGWVTCSMGRCGDLFSSCQKVNVQQVRPNWKWTFDMHDWIDLHADVYMFYILGLTLGFITLGFIILGFIILGFLFLGWINSWIHWSWILPTWFWHWSSSGFWVNIFVNTIFSLLVILWSPAPGGVLKTSRWVSRSVTLASFRCLDSGARTPVTEWKTDKILLTDNILDW